MSNRTFKGCALAVGIFFAVAALSVSAKAGSLRQGSSAQSSAVTGSVPGEVLWTYFDTTSFLYFRVPYVSGGSGGYGFAGLGDNIIRLINPNGAANGNLAGAKTQTVCAMIYVFDAAQEMGECCGCPLTSTQLATFSVDENLTSNWGIRTAPPIATGYLGTGLASNGNGSIAIVAASPNTVRCLGGGGGAACNGGCDPTDVPGYSVTTANNLLGSVTHHQAPFREMIYNVAEAPALAGQLTETALFDDAGGDPANLSYLQQQCGALVGNGTGGGICDCPLE